MLPITEVYKHIDGLVSQQFYVCSVVCRVDESSIGRDDWPVDEVCVVIPESFDRRRCIMEGKVVVVHAPAVQHELYIELFIEILEKARVVALYGVVIEIAAVIFTFAPFVESRLCDVDVAPRESVRPAVVPRVSSGAVAGIISVIGGRVALHDLLVVIISRYDFVRVFPVPFLVARVESVPANVVRLLDLDVDGAVLARGSSENVGLFILGDRISFVNGVNVSYPLSRAGHLIKILILVIHDCLFALFLLFLSLLTFILLSLLLCLLSRGLLLGIL